MTMELVGVILTAGCWLLMGIVVGIIKAIEKN